LSILMIRIQKSDIGDRKRELEEECKKKVNK
jgi:hypothetical protein